MCITEALYPQLMTLEAMYISQWLILIVQVFVITEIGQCLFGCHN